MIEIQIAHSKYLLSIGQYIQDEAGKVIQFCSEFTEIHNKLIQDLPSTSFDVYLQGILSLLFSSLVDEIKYFIKF